MPEIRIIGVPGLHQDHTKALVASQIEEEKKKKRGELSEAPQDELATFRTIEQAAQNMILAKMDSLGVPRTAFDQIIYATNPKGNFTEGISDPVGVSAIYVNRPVDTFDTFSTVAHAVSHMAVAKEVRRYLSSQDRNAPNQVWTSGAEVVGNRKPRASLVEEGMTTLDQVDFFNTYLQLNYPQEYARRRQLAESQDIREQAEKAIKGHEHDYGQISPTTLAPFVTLEAKRWPIIGKPRGKEPTEATLDAKRLKHYLFARRLCEVVGHALSPDQHLGPEQAFEDGRRALDRDRYLRTQDAHRLIVQVMGGAVIGAEKEDRERMSGQIHAKDPDSFSGQNVLILGGTRAKTLFGADPDNSESVDMAMAMFKHVHPRPKPLIEAQQTPKPSDLASQGQALEPAATVEPAIKPPSSPEAQAPVVSEAPAVAAAEIAPPAPSAEPEQASVEPTPKPQKQKKEETPQQRQIRSLNASIREIDGKRRAAEDRLTRILEGHPDNEYDDPEAERTAIEGFQDEIFRLTTERDQLQESIQPASPRGIEPPSHP